MKITSRPAIAIDGPAASGKSTVAKLVAKRLGCLFVNTGAMYRAVAWYMWRRGIDVTDSAAVVAELDEIPLRFVREGTESVVTCFRQILTTHLTEPEVNDRVSAVAAIPQVRDLLVRRQREFNLLHPVVMEGRDIGTVVFPNTPFKYFVTASEEVRATRRAAEGIADSIAERDKMDSSRATAPLRQADDAMLIDSSDLTIDQVVSIICDDVKSKTPKLK